MRDEDLEALRRGYEALNRGEVESVMELIDPDIEWRPGQDDPQSGLFTGRAEFARFLRSWNESFDEFRLEPEEMTIAGDSVAVVVHQSGRGHGSGIALDVRTVHLWTIRDGVAVAWSAHRNRAEALAAISSGENVEAVLFGYEAFNRGDIESSLTMIHPEVEWHTYIVPGPGGGKYHGHEGVRQLWSDARNIFGDFRNEPERVIDVPPDRVVSFVRICGTGKESGIPVEARIGHLFTFRDGRAIKVVSYQDRNEALRAAGIGARPA